MPQLTGRRRCKAGQGFTLIELLLVIVLILLLAGAMVFNFSTISQSGRLEEGADRMESLIRFARAQAANTGKRVQLAFEMDDTFADLAAMAATVQVRWEPDPLGQPGQFEPLPGVAAHVAAVNEFVLVEDASAPGAGAGGSANSTNATSEAQFPDLWLDETSTDWFTPVTFNPDGSSDSVRITLVSRDPEDLRRIELRLEGITGGMRRQLIHAATDEALEAPEDWEEPPAQNSGGIIRSSSRPPATPLPAGAADAKSPRNPAP